MSILVTGGAGYIGSVVVEELIRRDYDVVVLDNLQAGHRQAVSPQAALVQGDVGDAELLGRIFRDHAVEAVAHFAAEVSVPDSMKDPARYFDANLLKGVALLDAMRDNDCSRLIFSSTAAIFGDPQHSPVDEAHPQCPLSAYGESKLMFEHVLDWYHRAYGLAFIALRYFNAAGATDRLGEAHTPEEHLIPLLMQVALGRKPHIEVYGRDYPTDDGTCVRDYIHVADLAQAHVLALEGLKQHPAGKYNLGNGEGYSVLEVIHTAEKVVGKPIPVREAARRPGDPAVLVASSKLAKADLGWKAQHAELEDIVASAWRWHRAHPSGYGT